MSKSTINNSTNQIQGTLFPLSSLQSKKVEASFTSPDLSSFGGLLLMRECEKEIGFISSLRRCIVDSRSPLLIQHTYTEMLTQRIFQIAAGYEDADDCDLLREDSVLKLCAGKSPNDPPLSSQPTITRLENKLNHRELYDMGVAFVEQFIQSYDQEPEVVILDCDDSNANTYGEQQLTLFNNYYGEYCYMPLFIFEGISGKMILPLLRPGRGNKSINIFGLLTRIITLLRKSWKKTRFILRGDSHFCCKEFMDWAEDKKEIHFITGLTGNSVLFERTRKWVENAQKEYKRTRIPSKSYHRFMYKAKSWKYDQRVIVKIEISEKGVNIRFVVTSFKKSQARFLYEHLYCGRGLMELYIKEVKTYLFADRMSCNKFSANQFRLYIHAAAYVLLHAMKTQIFTGTPVEDYSMMTLREKVLLSSVLIHEKKKKIHIEFTQNHPHERELALVMQRYALLRSCG